MITRKKQTWFVAIILTFFMLLGICPNAINGDEEGQNYSLNSGISIYLPSEFTEFAVWNQMDDTAHGIKKMGFPSHSVAIETMEKDGIELITYRNDINQESGYAIRIVQYDAPETLSSDAILECFIEHNNGIITSLDSASTLGYGYVTINFVRYFKIYLETDNTQFDKEYVYLFVTKDGTIHEISFRNHNVNDDSTYLDEITYYGMISMNLPDSLINSLANLECESFTIKNGYHQSLFDYEDGASEPDGYNTTSQEEYDSIETINNPFQKLLSFDFPLWIIVAALALILLIGIRISKIGEWQEKPLSLENSKAIQGFAALAIIVHHLAQELADKADALIIFEEFGVLFVGIFFFFSGYGLYTSLKTKENYLKGFLKKRLVTILIPFYVCILVFVISACMKGQSFSLLEAIGVISGWSLINTHMWYIVEIAVLYIAFFIIYSLIKNRKAATTVMTIFVVCLIAGSLLLAHGEDLSCKYWFMGEWWYNTTLLFVFGIIVSQNENGFRKLARKLYVVLLPVFACLTVIFYKLTSKALIEYSYWSEQPGYKGYYDKFRCLIVQLPWVLFFVIALLLITMKVKFSNPILKFLGDISLELYLIHNLFLLGLHDGSIMMVTGKGLYVGLTILLSIGLATLLHGLDKYVISLINKAKTEIEENNRNHSIDTLRIIMAFLVVTIHIPFTGKVGDVFITYGKIAVPFFFVVGGYFLYRNNSQDMIPRLKKQAIKILILYVGGNILYSLANVLRASMDGVSLYYTTSQYLDLLLYNMSPFSEHLWYLGSLFYALVILMILNKFKAIDYVMFISPLLIAAYVVLSHMNVQEAYVLRNVVLVGLPYTMMGMLIRRYEDKLKNIKPLLLWILVLVLSITAIVELNTYKQGAGVPFISCELLVYVIVILCLKYPNFGKDTLAEKMGKELSLSIYILHIIPIMFMGTLIPLNTGLLSNYGAVTVFIITALIAALYNIIKKFVKSKFIKQA